MNGQSVTVSARALRAWLRTLGYTGQVRLPADLHGSREYATTTPDGRVEVYTVRPLITGAFSVTRLEVGPPAPPEPGGTP